MVINEGVTGRIVALLVLSLGLAGCDLMDASQHHINADDYVTRLSRALEVEAPTADAPAQLPLPRPRDLRISYSEDSLDLLEYLSLSDCQLQQVIAERNSSLGRVADATGRLRQELDFLRVGEDCAEEIREEEPELAARLDEALVTKRSELPKRIFEATLSGPAFRAFWRADYAPLIDAEVHSAMAALLTDVQRWVDGDYAGHDQLETQLKLISESSGGGVLLAWDEANRELSRATTMAAERQRGRPLCFEGMKTRQADVFFKVVNGYFIGGVQKTLSGVNRSTYDLMTQVEKLEAMTANVQPGAYRAWKATRDDMIAEGRNAMREHVESLDPLLRQCGFLPEVEQGT